MVTVQSPWRSLTDKEDWENPREKMEKQVHRRRKPEWSTKHIKRCSPSAVIREMEIKTVAKCYLYFTEYWQSSGGWEFSYSSCGYGATLDSNLVIARK